MLALILATGIVGLIVLQLCFSVYTSALSAARERGQQQLSKQLWSEQIDQARALRASGNRSGAAWSGYRKFVVAKKIVEGEGICSLYLVPHDRKPLPSFEPGQHLTFRIDLPGREQPIVRCYSLSDGPREDYYRVTVKRVPPPRDQPEAPAGLCSNYFNEDIQKGDILDVKAPAGKFSLDPTRKKPAVLIAGGVGITPMLSMLNAIVAANSSREVWLFYGCRNGREHVSQSHLRRLAYVHENIHVVVCYSAPEEADIQDRDYDHKGHISLDLIKQHLPTSNYRFFLCGPPPMMKSVTGALSEWGVPKEDVRSEAFGPASIKARKPATPKDSAEKGAAQKFKIQFSKSSKEAIWNGKAANLLEFSQDQGVEIDSACCAGSCGTCQVAVKSGEVGYETAPEFDVEEGCCLTCVGCPKGDVVLDA